MKKKLRSCVSAVCRSPIKSLSVSLDADQGALRLARLVQLS